MFTSAPSAISCLTSVVRSCSCQYFKRRRNWSNACVLFCRTYACGPSYAVVVFFVGRWLFRIKSNCSVFTSVTNLFPCLSSAFRKLQRHWPDARCLGSRIHQMRLQIFRIENTPIGLQSLIALLKVWDRLTAKPRRDGRTGRDNRAGMRWRRREETV